MHKTNNSNIEMKQIFLAIALMFSLAVQADDVMRKEKDGTYVVNTTTLAQDVEGYAEAKIGRASCRERV